jgi:predicted dehydrogenase
MDKVRIGVVGLGNMGSFHTGYMNSLPDASLGAVCDLDPEKRKKFSEKHGCPAFEKYQDLIDSKTCDAVLIATPHYDHPPIAEAAFKAGLHVLSEKPIGVTVGAARKLNETAAKYPNLKFGIVFQNRQNPIYKKMKELIAAGELGAVTRVTWLITDWFRTNAYYASGGWRATWAGEGGGVLINQCPHNLDLIQWITGIMPNRVTAVASIGKTHPIEVEDEVSAIFEYPNGAIGHFVTSTGEAPGTNRLEVCGEQGKLVSEHGKLTFVRTRQNVRDLRENSPKAFDHTENWHIEIPIKGSDFGQMHKSMTENFVAAILRGDKLVAEGSEGVKGLEIGNAMLYSGIKRTPVDLPMKGEEYDAFMQELIKTYGGKKTLKTKSASTDMAASSRV